MNEFDRFREYRRQAVRFWELRRLIYNFLLLPPTVLIYGFAHAEMAAADHAPVFGLSVVGILMFLGALAANACYSLVYLLEFWLADSHIESGWQSGGRTAIFVCGVLISIGLAMLGAYEIAHVQHHSTPIPGF